VNVKVSQVKLEQKIILSHSPSPIPPSPKNPPSRLFGQFDY
jgi:hypothetical protein